jgi:hypothetical protein
LGRGAAATTTATTTTFTAGKYKVPLQAVAAALRQFLS